MKCFTKTRAKTDNNYFDPASPQLIQGISYSEVKTAR